MKQIMVWPKRKKSKVAAMRMDLIINTISVKKINEGLPPTTDNLSKDWLPENSERFETSVIYIVDVRGGDGIFITKGEKIFVNDTPFEIDTLNGSTRKLILSATKGMLWLECDRRIITNMPLKYWIAMLNDESLIEIDDPIKRIKGERYSEDYEVIYGGNEVTVSNNKILYEHCYSSINSVVDLKCYPLRSLSELGE